MYVFFRPHPQRVNRAESTVVMGSVIRESSCLQHGVTPFGLFYVLASNFDRKWLQKVNTWQALLDLIQIYKDVILGKGYGSWNVLSKKVMEEAGNETGDISIYERHSTAP